MLRELGVDDASETYLGWLRDEAARRYIVAAANTTSLEDLRRYVAERAGRNDVLFLGIFTRDGLRHIGNLKYEPVDTERGYAIMGILIGDASWRGRAVAPEVLRVSAAWLKEHRGIRDIYLGVEVENDFAVRSYRKLGFVDCDTPYIAPAEGILRMRWAL